MKKILYSLIPKKLNNDILLFFFELLRKLQFPISKTIQNNYNINKRNMAEHLNSIKEHNGYIEDQNNYNDLKFGKVTMQYSGCEIIATYNALFSLAGNVSIDLEKMILDFEKNAMVLSGKFGSSPKAISKYFKSMGYITKLTTKEFEFSEISEEFDSLILTFYNDRNDITRQIHTVCITKKDNLFTAHNVYCNGMATKPYTSIQHLIADLNYGKAKAISLIGLKAK